MGKNCTLLLLIIHTMEKLVATECLFSIHGMAMLLQIRIPRNNVIQFCFIVKTATKPFSYPVHIQKDFPPLINFSFSDWYALQCKLQING